MHKSKFDISWFAAMGWMLCGCDAMRVPEPASQTQPLRASFTAIIYSDGQRQLFRIARPVDDGSERTPSLDWFDVNGSYVSVAKAWVNGRSPVWSRFSPGSSLSAWASIDSIPDSESLSVRGVLRWNASTPFTLAAGNTVVDSFELHPERAQKATFLTESVRGDIDLRWPKLSRPKTESLAVWARRPDSVEAFLNDWIGLCKSRGAPNERVLSLDQQASPPQYRWKLPDTGDIRKIMSGLGSMQTVFTVGDTIWVPSLRSARVYLRVSSDPGQSLWGTTEMVDPKWDFRFVEETFAGPALASNDSGREMRFGLSWGGSWFMSPTPYRQYFQINGACPSIFEWRSYGSTDRLHRPRGNVAPFDGYFCRTFPDTVSFPRGDVLPMPPDTASLPKLKPVIIISDTLKSILKVSP